MKTTFLYCLLLVIVNTCNPKQERQTEFDDPNCFFTEDHDLKIEGVLTINSKGIPLIDFTDSVFNGKIRIINKELYPDIYMNYDAYLFHKNPEDTACTVNIYGHYVSPVDTTNWVHDRRDFYVHQMGYSF